MAKAGNMIGAWAFLIGVILAIIFAFFGAGIWLSWLFLVIGLVVGLLNIADAETQPFLIAGVILVIVGSFGGNVFTSAALGVSFVSQFLNNLLMLFVPATIVVALKSVFSMAKG
ncbi:MAG: hypothetical protein NTX24_04295 [Candidatus Pacearchaeota archaeon]|nr:hypothetical protein [Candidatus Pacearchaeota archaeon]